MAENTAIIRNTRETGRIGGIPGIGYLLPGQEYELPEELALKLADPSVGLVIVRVVPAPEADSQFKAEGKPRRKRYEK